MSTFLRIPRATRESLNNPGDRGQVSLTMRSLGVNEPAQYTVSTKDGRMMIDAKGWSRFKSKSYLAVGMMLNSDVTFQVDDFSYKKLFHPS